jgi:hypothetical protein
MDGNSASNARATNVSGSSEHATAPTSHHQVHISADIEFKTPFFLPHHITALDQNISPFIVAQRGKRVSDGKHTVAAHPHSSADGLSSANTKTGATNSSPVVAPVAHQSMNQMAVPTVSSLSSSLSSSYSQPPLFTVTSVSVSTGPIKTAKPARSAASVAIRPLQQAQQRQQPLPQPPQPQPPQPQPQQPQPPPPPPQQQHASLSSSKAAPPLAAHVSASGRPQTVISDKHIAGKNISANSKRPSTSSAESTALVSESVPVFSRGAAEMPVETTALPVRIFAI